MRVLLMKTLLFVMRVLLMKTLLFMLFIGPVQLSVIQTKTSYHFWPCTWTTAEQLCQDTVGGELKLVRTAADVTVNVDRYMAWCGLHRPSPLQYNATFTSPQWQWAGGGSFTPNFSQEPEDYQNCAATVYNGTLMAIRCQSRLFFFCQDSNRTFTFINRTMDWWNAGEHCRTLNQTLATFDTRSQNSPNKVRQDFSVWTGLRLGSPDEGICVAISSLSGQLWLQSCSAAFPFLCDRHNLELELQELSWDQAEEHCRNLTSTSSGSFSLLSLDHSDLQYVLSHTITATTRKVWVGLRFLAGSWFWSDGAPVSLSLSECPELGCGALNLDSGSIELSDCSLKLNLLCYDPSL